MRLMEIKPLDNTFFGDGKRLQKGVSNIATSKDMPYPSVFFGTIFTGILANNDNFREAFFKYSRYDHEKILKIGQVYLCDSHMNRLYVKAPKDIFCEKEKERIKLGMFQDIDGGFSSIKFPKILRTPQEIGKEYRRIEDKYIDVLSLHRFYNREKLGNISLLDGADVFIKSDKIGIGMDKDTGRARTGLLYTIEQTEFNDFSRFGRWRFVVEYEIDTEYVKKNYSIDSLTIEDAGYLKLGGETKVATYSRCSEKIMKVHEKYQKNIHEQSVGGIFKMVFTSDAFFKEELKSVFGEDFEILGIASGKPLVIGGYDMKPKKSKKKGGHQRESYRGYEGGTVILLKSLKQDEDIKAELKKRIEENVKGFCRWILIKN